MGFRCGESHWLIPRQWVPFEEEEKEDRGVRRYTMPSNVKDEDRSRRKYITEEPTTEYDYAQDGGFERIKLEPNTDYSDYEDYPGSTTSTTISPRDAGYEGTQSTETNQFVDGGQDGQSRMLKKTKFTKQSDSGERRKDVQGRTLLGSGDAVVDLEKHIEQRVFRFESFSSSERSGRRSGKIGYPTGSRSGKIGNRTRRSSNRRGKARRIRRENHREGNEPNQTEGSLSVPSPAESNMPFRHQRVTEDSNQSTGKNLNQSKIELLFWRELFKISKQSGVDDLNFHNRSADLPLWRELFAKISKSGREGPEFLLPNVLESGDEGPKFHGRVLKTVNHQKEIYVMCGEHRKRSLVRSDMAVSKILAFLYGMAFLWALATLAMYFGLYILEHGIEKCCVDECMM